MVVSTISFKDPVLQLLSFSAAFQFLVTFWIVCVLWTMVKFQDLENQRRALILVYQIMHMHIDQQPAVDRHGNRRPPSTVFSRLCDRDPDYQRMLEEVMFEDTAAKKRNRSQLIDIVCNERNNSAHPVDLDDLLTEAKNLVFALKYRALRCMFTPIPNLETKLLILSNCSEIISRRHRPPGR